MSYTVDDSMVKIVYDLSDREIYNDIRGELGITKTETVVDDDADYSWKFWTKYCPLPAPGYTTFKYFTATLQDPITWQLTDVSVWDYEANPYFDYEIGLVDTNDDLRKAVRIKNTGSSGGSIQFTVRYKYLSASQVTHEEISWDTLTVRAIDETSIQKYGRRVMPLKWPQGATKAQMQMVADAALAHYKDPYHVLHITLRGDTAGKATQIFTREISDIITVTCDNLGMTAEDHFIDAVSIDDTSLRSPVAKWQLISQRAAEVTDWFKFGDGHFGGPEVLG